MNVLGKSLALGALSVVAACTNNDPSALGGSGAGGRCGLRTSYTRRTKLRLRRRRSWRHTLQQNKTYYYTSAHTFSH